MTEPFVGMPTRTDSITVAVLNSDDDSPPYRGGRREWCFGCVNRINHSQRFHQNEADREMRAAERFEVPSLW